MNTSAELIIDELDTPSSPRPHTASEMGAKAATQYLRTHSREADEESLLQEIAGNAIASAFIFGLFLGHYVRR